MTVKVDVLAVVRVHVLEHVRDLPRVQHHALLVTTHVKEGVILHVQRHVKEHRQEHALTVQVVALRVVLLLVVEHVKAVVDWQCLVPKFVLEIDFSQLSKSIRVVRISVQLPFCLTDYLGLRFPATIF